MSVSFEFEVQAILPQNEAGVSARGIAIVQNKPAISIEIEAPMAGGMAFAAIRRENGELVFKTEGEHILSQYAWIQANPETFFSEAYRFGLDAISNRSGLFRDVSKERGEDARRLLDRILRSSTKSPVVPAPRGMKGVLLQADAVYKRQLAEYILDRYDSDFLDDISVSQWHLFASNKKPQTYILDIRSREGLVGLVFKSVTVTIQNLNRHTEIPFDAVTTPFESILIWENQQ